MYHKFTGPGVGAVMLPITGFNVLGLAITAMAALFGGILLLRLTMRPKTTMRPKSR